MKKIGDAIKVKNRSGGPTNALRSLAPKRATRLSLSLLCLI